MQKRTPPLGNDTNFTTRINQLTIIHYSLASHQLGEQHAVLSVQQEKKLKVHQF